MKYTKFFLIALFASGLVGFVVPVYANGFKSVIKTVEQFEKDISNTRSFDVPAKGNLEVAFSPNEGGEHLVIKTIDSANKELLVIAYSFTSSAITKALVAAIKDRHVIIHLVADYEENIVKDKYGKSKAALSALKNAGADIRIISAYPTHHDKVIIADRNTVELGSFNYSSAAANSNSENVLVNWNNPELAAVYIGHFERNYRQSREYTASY